MLLGADVIERIKELAPSATGVGNVDYTSESPLIRVRLEAPRSAALSAADVEAVLGQETLPDGARLLRVDVTG